MVELQIRDSYIRLCDALKFCGAAATGGMAKMLILDGAVTVNGEVCLIKGKKLIPGDWFTLQGESYKITL